MAEFLIKATSANWMDDTSKWVSKGVTQRMYDARSQVGDIIVVKPDSWVWGNKECLPQFVVGKVPNITEEEAKKYEEKLEQDEVITLQRTIDKKDWEDIKKQESFIIENRFTVIPTIIKTEEVERIKVVALADLTKSIDF